MSPARAPFMQASVGTRVAAWNRENPQQQERSPCQRTRCRAVRRRAASAAHCRLHETSCKTHGHVGRSKTKPRTLASAGFRRERR